MKLVKIKSTNEYKLIYDTEFDSNLHIDRSNELQYLHQNAKLGDYITIRNMVISAVNSVGGFDSLRELDKPIALIYTKSVTIEEAVPYYISQGLTVNEASYIYLQKFSQNIRNAADCFKERARSVEFATTIMMYLGQTNAETFISNTRDLLSDLTDSAIIGTQYGNVQNGFMDYIEDTGSYIGSGSSTFFNLPTDQEKHNAFKNKIIDIILN